MEKQKRHSVIELPVPTDEQLEGWKDSSHQIEHNIASWQLMQIVYLLCDLAYSAPKGFWIKVKFLAWFDREPKIREMGFSYRSWIVDTFRRTTPQK